MVISRSIAVFLALVLAVSCDSTSEDLQRQNPVDLEIFEVDPERLLMPPVSLPADRPGPNPARNAYFGDLHVHSKWSMDAFVFLNTCLYLGLLDVIG